MWDNATTPKTNSINPYIHGDPRPTAQTKSLPIPRPTPFRTVGSTPVSSDAPASPIGFRRSGALSYINWEIESGWFTNEVKAHGLVVKKKIINVKSEYLKHVSFKEGDGRKIAFWVDIWCGDDSFKGLLSFAVYVSL